MCRSRASVCLMFWTRNTSVHSCERCERCFFSRLLFGACDASVIYQICLYEKRRANNNNKKTIRIHLCVDMCGVCYRYVAQGASSRLKLLYIFIFSWRMCAHEVIFFFSVGVLGVCICFSPFRLYCFCTLYLSFWARFFLLLLRTSPSLSPSISLNYSLWGCRTLWLSVDNLANEMMTTIIVVRCVFTIRAKREINEIIFGGTFLALTSRDGEGVMRCDGFHINNDILLM